MYNSLGEPLMLSIQRPATITTRITGLLICALDTQRFLRSRVSRLDLWTSCWAVDAGDVILLLAKVAFRSVFFEELDVAVCKLLSDRTRVRGGSRLTSVFAAFLEMVHAFSSVAFAWMWCQSHSLDCVTIEH